MGTEAAAPPLVTAKLAAFERIEAEVRASFLFVEAVHGQARMAAFPLSEIVRYLHALWVCEQKDRLLTVARTHRRYDGLHALALLGRWQHGETAEVVAFLQFKLDSMPFADLTRQIEAAEQAGDAALAQRLTHGRQVLWRRGMHLLLAFEAIFALAPDALIEQVRTLCAAQGDTPEAIERALAQAEDPLYGLVRHADIARRNMVFMNALGAEVLHAPEDTPGNRTARVLPGTLPLAPLAQQVISPELLHVPPHVSTTPVADQGP